MVALLLFLVASTLQFSPVNGAPKCPLCNSLTEVPRRLDYVLEVNPFKTCADAWLQLGSLNSNSGQCSSLQNQYREKCCGNAEPPPIYVPPTAAPRESSGTEPMCRLCRNDDYPGKPNARVVARYIGDYSCGQLYDRGRNGLLPGFMCGPLQHFAFSVCGCPSPEPAPTRRPTRPPTREPTPRPNPQPTRRPTRPPTRPPTPRPNPQPTRRPTPQPTRNPTPRPSPRPTPRPTKPPTPPPTRNPTPEPTPYPTSLPSATPTAYPTSLPSSAPTTGPTKEPTPGPSRFPTPRPTRGPTPPPSRYPIAPTFEASQLTEPTTVVEMRKLPASSLLGSNKSDMKFARRTQGGANNIVRGIGIDRVIPNEVPV